MVSTGSRYPTDKGKESGGEGSLLGCKDHKAVKSGR
jgi:hypothetical protein